LKWLKKLKVTGRRKIDDIIKEEIRHIAILNQSLKELM